MSRQYYNVQKYDKQRNDERRRSTHIVNEYIEEMKGHFLLERHSKKISLEIAAWLNTQEGQNFSKYKRRTFQT